MKFIRKITQPRKIHSPAAAVVVVVVAPTPNDGNAGATLAVGAVPNNEGAEVLPGAAAVAGVPNVRLIVLKRKALESEWSGKRVRMGH